MSKKIKLTDPKVDPKKQKKGEATLSFTRGKETRSYKPADTRTGSPAYGPESKSKPTPGFVKRAQAAKQDVVFKGGMPYRAGHTTVSKEKDRVNVQIPVKADIKPVKLQMPAPQTAASSGIRKPAGKGIKLKPMRMVAGGSDKKDNPANKVGVGKRSGFKSRSIKRFRKPGY